MEMEMEMRWGEKSKRGDPERECLSLSLSHWFWDSGVIVSSNEILKYLKLIFSVKRFWWEI